jgi:threonine dehydratase
MTSPFALPASIPIADIRAAQARIRGRACRTPLVRLYHENFSGEIYLKLENLQPIGSFKIRGACNAISLAPRESLAEGVVTPSAGNMAQGVAWMARELKIPCTVIVPDHAPAAKLDAVTRMGAQFIKIPLDDWWQVILNHRFDGVKGFFVHPVSDQSVIAGNGTVGIEIAEDLPDVDAVIVPYGGGGLISGIASALKALKPSVKVYASEVSTASPLAASLKAESPQRVEYTPTFIDGIGSSTLIPEMWPLVRSLAAGSIVVSPREIAAAVKFMLLRSRIIAEGAGGSSLAAGLTGKAGNGKIVCVVSGGNIDFEKIARIMRDELP